MARGYVYEDDATGWRQMLASDLPSSGVTSGTYGDATHVGQFTVDAYGLITAASSVAITGGGGGITDLTSTGSTITVTNPTGPTTNVDLPTSGVSAGTYGDSTHVAEVTVDAEGRVTSATAVAISGSGGAGGLITLYDSGYLASDAASIDTGAGGIASGHVTLLCFLYGRTSDSTYTQNIAYQVNADSGANYSFQRFSAAAATLQGSSYAGQTYSVLGALPGASHPANVFGACEATIPCYDGTANYKTITSRTASIGTTTGTTQLWSIGTLWASTSAISRLAVYSQSGGNLKAGSRLIVCGAS